MWPFSKKEDDLVSMLGLLEQLKNKNPAPQAPKVPRRRTRLKDRTWSPMEDPSGYTQDQIMVAVLQDLRDELKALNTRLASFDRAMRQAFGLKEDE